MWLGQACFRKKILCFFCVCVLSPSSLVPFAKFSDSNCTICFERPNVLCHDLKKHLIQDCHWVACKPHSTGLGLFFHNWIGIKYSTIRSLRGKYFLVILVIVLSFNFSHRTLKYLILEAGISTNPRDTFWLSLPLPDAPWYISSRHASSSGPKPINILSRAREAGSPLKAAARARTRDTHCPLAH